MNRVRTSIVIILLSVLPASLALGQSFRVTLLGSGETFPQQGRLGPSILVEAGDKTYVFDTGRGVLQRFGEVDGFGKDLDGVFFTHLHSDHVIGLPGLWLGTWMFSRRGHALPIFGPAGTQNMLAHIRQAFSFDVDIRILEGANPSGAEFTVTEIEDGFRWEDGDVVIRAFAVDHAPIEPAFGYRIDFGGRSIALSGDTRFSEVLIEAVTGVDLLIHEVSDASEEFVQANPRFRDVVMAHHTTAAQAGEVFTQVQPKLAVYAHMVLRDLSFVELVDKTRTTYQGPLIVGEDLMIFDVAEEIGISIKR